MIQNDLLSAQGNSIGLQKAGTGLENTSIAYDASSNISAIGNAKSAFQSSENGKRAYKQALSDDAEHISTLGNEFSNLDAQISGMIAKGF
ncbi:MAG: TIGR04197 family type VII secretion effector [Hespellia sp.]|nr:TIGR04197 family type VII secretion effector [Hespellia sp.]